MHLKIACNLWFMCCLDGFRGLSKDFNNVDNSDYCVAYRGYVYT